MASYFLTKIFFVKLHDIKYQLKGNNLENDHEKSYGILKS